MSRSRFLTESLPTKSGETVLITGDELHHLHSVKRCHVGEEIELIDPKAAIAFLGKIESLSKKEACIRLDSQIEPAPLPQVRLCIGVSKFPALRTLVEKTVEIGVRGIHFFHAERSSQNLNNQAINKLERIAFQTLKQAGPLPWCPEITLSGSLEELLKGLPKFQEKAQIRFVCAPSSQKSFFDALGENETPPSQPPENTGDFQNPRPSAPPGDSPKKSLQVYLENLREFADSYVVIGPEGGLSPEELRTCQQHDFQRISLGLRTLRVETAAIVACSLMKFSREA